MSNHLPLTLLLALFATPVAFAGIGGDTVNVAFAYADGPYTDDLGNRVAGPGASYSYVLTEIALGADTLAFTFTGDQSYSSSSFTGYVFSNLSQNFPVEYMLRTAPDFFTADRFSTSGNIFSVNFQNLDFLPTDSVIFSLLPLAAVPEPETYALLLAGLGLMGGIARWKHSRIETAARRRLSPLPN